MRRILGIDPGIRATGYGLVEAEGGRCVLLDAGIIAPDPDAPLVERLLCIEREVTALFERWRPVGCAVENVFYHKNAKSMITLGRAQAAALLCAGRAGLEPALYSPSEVKQALTGGGAAAKQQVRFMVERIIGRKIEESRDDVSDALAVAICHAGRADSPLNLARGR